MEQIDHGMNPIESLIADNTAAADIISGDREGLDSTGADLILRNLAVVTDRLKPTDFARLPKEVQDQLFAVAFMADDIAPMAEEDLVRRPHEDDASYEYRTGIWQRIHNLQSYVHTRSHDLDDPRELSKLRFAVHGASLAFASVVDAARGVPAVAETIRYFRGNTDAAGNRASYVVRLAFERDERTTDDEAY